MNTLIDTVTKFIKTGELADYIAAVGAIVAEMKNRPDFPRMGYIRLCSLVEQNRPRYAGSDLQIPELAELLTLLAEPLRELAVLSALYASKPKYKTKPK